MDYIPRTIANDEYVIKMYMSSNGFPEVIFEKRNPNALDISYLVNSHETYPSIKLPYTMINLNNVPQLISQIEIAQKAAQIAYDTVNQMFKLPKQDPAGNDETRTEAIMRLIQEHQKKNLGAPTHDEINAAINSCYVTDTRSDTQKSLDTIYNVFVFNEINVSNIDTLHEYASDYIQKREYHIELSQEPHETYDADAVRSADISRYNAHNKFISKILAIARPAHKLGVDNEIANLATLDNPYNKINREYIAQFAYQLAN